MLKIKKISLSLYQNIRRFVHEGQQFSTYELELEISYCICKEIQKTSDLWDT